MAAVTPRTPKPSGPTRRRGAAPTAAGARPTGTPRPDTGAHDTGATRPTGVARPRGAARREALLEAVLRIVADVGPDAVTHRRVAEEAELPLASTTYWFDSKEHLLTAALELAAERDTARLLAASSSHPTGDETVDELVDAVVGTMIDSCTAEAPASRRSLMATYSMMLEAARRPALREVSQRWAEVYLLTLGQLLERAGSKHPREDAELLLGAADGLLIGQLAQGDTRDLRPPLRRLAKALVTGS